MPLTGWAQVSVTDFVLSALEDKEVASLDKRISYLKAMPFRLAPIQRMEFRTRNNQLDPQRQDFALRITPTNPWESKNNNLYFQEYERGLHLERDLALKKALKWRYELLVETAFQNDRLAKQRQVVELTEMLLSVHSQQQSTRDFDADDLLEARIDLIDLQLEMDEMEMERRQLLAQVSALFPAAGEQASTWTLGDLIDPKLLLRLTDSLLTLNPVGGEVAYRQSRFNLAVRETAVQKSNMNLGFLQAQYEPYRTEQGREPWSLSLGLLIPVFNPNKGDETEGKLEQMEAQFEWEETRMLRQEEKLQLRTRLSDLLEQYGTINDRQQQVASGEVQKAILSGAVMNPILILRYRESMLKISGMKLKIARQALLAYVDILDRCEVLQMPPLANQLDRQAE